jgi:hypothetical protein
VNQKLDSNKLPRFEVILASLFYLMSQYIASPRREIAYAVSEHFERLHQHPECESKILRDVGKNLHLQWRGLTDPTMTRFGRDKVRVH